MRLDAEDASRVRSGRDWLLRGRASCLGQTGNGGSRLPAADAGVKVEAGLAYLIGGPQKK